MHGLSVIIPVLNEQATIVDTLLCLQALRERGNEVIVVDGGSRDATRSLATAYADTVITAPKGRGTQLNQGAAQAQGHALLFLHADTRAPRDVDCRILQALAGGCGWGRFDVSLSGRHPLLRVVERLMNLRSRWTGIATGDQGIFVSSELFHRLGGFPEQPLMEDIAFSRELKKVTRPHCLRTRLITSSRRWEQQGIVATILRMWTLRLAYYLGVPAGTLARRYD